MKTNIKELRKDLTELAKKHGLDHEFDRQVRGIEISMNGREIITSYQDPVKKLKPQYS